MNRPCTTGAIASICGCMDYYDTDEKAAAFRKAEAKALELVQRKPRSVESEARSVMNEYRKAVESAERER